MAEPTLIDATWVAGYEAQLSDGTVLVPNETVVPVPEGEARDSDNWRPVSTSAPALPPKKVEDED